MKILIIGGVAGGASCAARLRRLSESAEIILFEKGEHISFANCGLPYYIGDVIKDAEKLLVQTPEAMHARFNIDVRVNSEVIEIDKEAKHVTVFNHISQTTYQEDYDKLVLSPGASPIKPNLDGLTNHNVFTLRNIPDTMAIRHFVDTQKPKSAVVVGGGYIGLEMAENLYERNLAVSIVEMADQVLGVVDPEMSSFLEAELIQKGIQLHLKDGITGVSSENGDTLVHLTSGQTLKTDLVILGIGVRPDIEMIRKAGIAIGNLGGIVVNEHLQTSHPDVYAVGDAIEVEDFIRRSPAIIPLAGPANKQGRIVANQILGIPDQYEGTQGTSILKLFDLAIATTGNNEKLLKRFSIPYEKSYTHSSSNAGYYPGATTLSIKLLFSPKDGKILGATIVGTKGVDKRMDVLATAMRLGATVHQLQNLELSYAPPFSSAKDPVNMAGYVASNILNKDVSVIHWDTLKTLDMKNVILLDVRTPAEYAKGTIPEAINMPIDHLRSRLHEIPHDKTIIVFCQVGLRGYLAYRILTQSAFHKIYNLSGGYKTYQMASRFNLEKANSQLKHVNEQGMETE